LTNIVVQDTSSGRFYTTASSNISTTLDTFKQTGLRTGDGFIDGNITGSNELLIQKSSGEGTPAFGTSNVAVFQNNDSSQDASIAIIAADSKKSQIHFGKHDDIDVGGIRYFHEDHGTNPDQLHMRVNGGIAGIFAPVLTSKRGLRLGDNTNVSGSEGDLLSIQGNLGGNGLTISSSAGTRIKFKRGANGNQHLFEYFTGATRKWSLGNAGESNDNFYLYNTDSNVKFIELIDGGNSTHIHTNVTASGAVSASGNLIANNITASGNISASGFLSASTAVLTNLFAGLNEASQNKIVYYNTDDGELTFEDGAKLLDEAGLLSSSAQIASDISGAFSGLGLLSSSAQIASDISGAFTSISSSIATDIATNVTNITSNTSAINTLNAAGLISSSGLSSPAQGEAQLTLNNVPQVTIDLGLQITDNVTFNHITASGNISSSGNLSATGDLDIDGAADITSTLTVGSHITASGNISASGHLFASASLNNDTDLKTVVYDSSSGEFFHTTLSPGDAVVSIHSSNNNTILIDATSTTQPIITAVTAAVSNGSLNLVTGDAVHSYALAISSTDYVGEVKDGAGISIFNQGLVGGGTQAEVSFDPGGSAGELITSGDTSGGSDLYESHSTLIYDGTDLQVHGGDIIAFYSSDKRLKDNVTPISNPIKKILQIGGYTFDWNEKQDTYKGHDVGVIAQEIEKVLPEVVETRENGYKAVKYQKIVPLLIEAIKDQQKQIDELKNLIKNGNR
jgi:hypothetical protein